jgi:hypothetical protein
MTITVLSDELTYMDSKSNWSFKSKGSLISAYDLADAVLVHEQFNSHDEITLFNLDGEVLGSIRSQTQPSEQFSSFVSIKPLLPLVNRQARVVDFMGVAYIADFKEFQLRPIGFVK